MSFARPIVSSSRRADILAVVGQVAFPFPFVLFDPADLSVSIRVGSTALFQSVTTGFTVAVSPDLSNAVVTFALPVLIAASTVPVTVRLDGRRVQSRLMDVTRGGVISSLLLEAELDRESIILQELRRDTSDALTQAAQALAMVSALVGPAFPVQVSQAKVLLGTLGYYDAVEAALTRGLIDPAVIAWGTGGPVSIGGPLMIVIQRVLGLSSDGVLAFLAAAALVVL